MPQLHLIHNPKVLGSCRELQRPGSRLVVLNESPLAARAIEASGLPPWSPTFSSRTSDEDWLRDYLEIMDRLAAENGKQQQWWLTDVASRNRFTSPLVRLLGELELALAAMKECQADTQLLLLAPSWPVSLALSRAAEEQGWSVHHYARPGARLAARARGLLHAYGRIVFGVARTLLRIVQTRRDYGLAAPRAGKSPAYVIKSFVNVAAFRDGRFTDPFFPGLAEHLSKDGGSVVTVAEAHQQRRECHRAMAAHTEAVPDMPLIPVELYLKLGDVLLQAVRLLLGRLTRPFRPVGGSFLGVDVGPLVAECLASGGWSMHFAQSVYGSVGRRLARRHGPQSVVLTYEGNPWERAFLSGIHEGHKGALRVGYQHAAVPLAAAGVFTTKHELLHSPMPDRILTTGPSTRRIIEKYSPAPHPDIRSCCALRYAYLFGSSVVVSKPAAFRDPLEVLVVLEGVWGVRDLLEYVLDEAPSCQDFHFLIRAHPVLPLEDLLRKAGRSLEGLANVAASKDASVLEDLQRTDVLLYWGSTMSFEGVLLGKPILHFDRGDRPSYDPLFELESYRRVVGRGVSLHDTLQDVAQWTPEARERNLRHAQDYLREYFSPVNVGCLELFTKAKML